MTIKFLPAFNGDCILISFKEEDNQNRNILIDGGISKTYYDPDLDQFGELYHEIDRIKKLEQKVDLLILTHIDDDHIGGILCWLERDKDAAKYIGDVWFNSGKLIAKYLNKPENESLKMELKGTGSAYTGVQQGIDFEKYLLDNKVWSENIIVAENEVDMFGLKFNILSPTKSKLKSLLNFYFKKTKDSVYTSGSGLNDWLELLSEIIEVESQKGFKQDYDSTAPNGSSIAFILSNLDKKYLFLADAHPSIIVKSLQQMGYTKENKLVVEFVKVSHHGSKKNTSKKLLELIKTNHYVFLTDSSGHGHPHKATLARVVSENENAVFHFNYDYVKKNIFNADDIKNFKMFKRYYSKQYPFKLE